MPIFTHVKLEYIPPLKSSLVFFTSIMIFPGWGWGYIA